MLRLRCLVVLLLLLASRAALAAEADLKARIDALAQPVTGSGTAVGIVVGIVDGEKTAAFGYGKLSPGSAGTPGAQTLFEIGSVTKVFTGLLLADMVQRKLVALDAPVAGLLPPPVKVPDRDGRKITLLDLATHTSGLPRLPANLLPQIAANPGNPYAKYTVEELYQDLAKEPLSAVPGTKFAYSNFGMGLLGHALARKAGADYESLVEQRICRPLGMTETRISLSEPLRARFSPGHDIDGRPLSPWDIPTLAGAGALRSTADDLLRFVVANLRLRSGPLDEAILFSHVPRREIGPDAKIALGWHIRVKEGIYFHNGQTGGYHSFVAFRPERKIGVVVLSNTAGGIGDELGLRVLKMLAGEMVEPPPVRTPVRLDPALLDRYAGNYEIFPNFTLHVFRDGDRLMAQATGQPRLGLYPSSETRFFYRAVDAEVEFVKEADGQVNKLVLHQHGLHLSGWRNGILTQLGRKALQSLQQTAKPETR